MSDVIHLSEEALFMLLGAFALPADDTDCASIASELIWRVYIMEWDAAISVVPANWYCIPVPQNPIY